MTDTDLIGQRLWEKSKELLEYQGQGCLLNFLSIKENYFGGSVCIESHISPPL